MNKNLISISIASALLSTTTMASEVYSDEDTTIKVDGRVEVRANFSDANKSSESDSAYKDASRIRINVEGEEKVSESVSLIARAEFEIAEKAGSQYDSNHMNTRHLYAGADTSFGRITYGHQNNAITMITDWSDLSEVYSGYVNEYSVSSGDRANNILAYSLDFGEGFSLATSLNLNSESQNGSIDNKHTGFGIAGSYDVTDSLSFGLGYNQSESVDSSDDTSSSALLMAAKYVKEGFNVAATYHVGELTAGQYTDTLGESHGTYLASGSFLSGTTGFTAADLYAGYTFGDNNVNMTYSSFQVDNKNLDALDANFVAVEYARYIKNSSLYVAYKKNLLDEGQGGILDNDQDEVQIGFRYMF